jgi:hypothetical protein
MPLPPAAAGGKPVLPGRLRGMADMDARDALRPLNRASRTSSQANSTISVMEPGTPGGRGDTTCSVAPESKGSLIGY